MKPILYILLFIITYTKVIGQCYTDEYHEHLLQTDSVYRFSFQKYKSSRTTNSTQRIGAYTNVKIPVVVHVVHNGELVGGGTNIPDEQINNAIQILNNRFANAGGVNTQISFCLAKKKEDGSATTGIVRVLGPYNTYIPVNQDNDIKISPWYYRNYLNIWVCNLDLGANGDVVKGYSKFPFSSSITNNFIDGVVIDYEWFGTGGSAVAASDGATLPHEVGHWLGLYHVFKDTDENCTETTTECSIKGDEVCDTPVLSGSATLQIYMDPDNGYLPDYTQRYSGCVGNVDLYSAQNLMDYNEEEYMLEFTEEQKYRMHQMIYDYRTIIGNYTTQDKSEYCNGITCTDGYMNGTEIGIDCGGNCPNSCTTTTTTNPIVTPGIGLDNCSFYCFWPKNKVITGRTYTAFEADRGKESILAFTDVKLKSSSNVKYITTGVIDILPGFEIEYGAKFETYIENCNGILCRIANPYTNGIDTITTTEPDSAYLKTESGFHIYPNPSTGKYTVELQPFEGEISISNTLGQDIHNIVTNENNTHYEIDISTQPSGIYFMEMKKDGQVVFRTKILKE